MIDLDKNTVDLTYFRTIVRELKNDDIGLSEQILDSFSDNQFSSKIKVIEMLDSIGAIDKNSNVGVFGSWFNSILAASLSSRVNSIIGYDLDSNATRMGSRMYINHPNVSFVNIDIHKDLNEDNDVYSRNVIINPSCEHMIPMKEWRWDRQRNDCVCVFQSNDMFGIPGHINCVSSINEFRDQLPKTVVDKTKKVVGEFRILLEEELKDTRGTRYTIVGEYSKW